MCEIKVKFLSENRLFSGVSKPLTSVASISYQTRYNPQSMIGELAAYIKGLRVRALKLKAARTVTGGSFNSPITRRGST